LILLIPKRNAVTVVPDRSPGEDAEIPAPGIDELSIVVDIANVMGARPDGWWKDRAGAAARLCREVAALSRRGLAASDLPAGLPGVAGDGDRAYPHWVLVLEGAARKAAMDDGRGHVSLVTEEGSESHQSFPAPGPAARLVLAPGPGDDTIAAQARDLQGCRLVVTADRELRLRCEQAGAMIAGPRWLLALL
jgi:8-oxo-dGTP diphosphatase